MKFSLASLVFAAGLAGSIAAFAETPATAPAGSTGLCKDGSYTTNATKKGACAGHRGVQAWYAGQAGMSTGTAPPAPAAGAPAATTQKPPASAAQPVPEKTAATPAAGGGPGQVWVNSSSKVYHCAGSKYYGKTKHGAYMTESEAKAAGNHADHGKACS